MQLASLQSVLGRKILQANTTLTVSLDPPGPFLLGNYVAVPMIALHPPKLPPARHPRIDAAGLPLTHYFTGMEYPEIARALGISLSTVERQWAYARSWLYREMKKNLPNR